MLSNEIYTKIINEYNLLDTIIDGKNKKQIISILEPHFLDIIKKYKIGLIGIFNLIEKLSKNKRKQTVRPIKELLVDFDGEF